MTNSKPIFFLILFGLLFFLNLSGFTQSGTNLLIKGRITDASNNNPISFAGIELANSKIKTTSDLEGHYSITCPPNVNKIKFSCVGYESETRQIAPGKSQVINVSLKSSNTYLKEVIVKAPKKKYKNKNNPAVELIESVISHKSMNRKEGLNFFEFEKYEKTKFALSNINEKLKQRKSLRKFRFVFENIDSTSLAGTKILPVYLKETLSEFYFRKSPKATKEIVKANKMVSFEGYIDDQGLTAYLKYLYQDINIYDNEISFLSNQFLSPIANTAPAFYKYYITDTVKISGIRCIKVFFSPRSKTDMLFQGFLYINQDSSFSVKKAEISVNKDINLNWVKEVSITQEFENIEQKGWLLSKDEISIDFGITNNGMGIFGQRTISYQNYKIDQPQPDSIYKGQEVVFQPDMNEKKSEYWNSHRHQALSATEMGVYLIIDSVKKVPAFKRTMNIAMLLLSGFRDFGKWETGPVNTFYSYNPIEGVRLRFGGRTTPAFSKKIYFESYLAYGFTDKKPKYYFSTTYSLSNRSIYSFPINYLRLSVQKETKIPGQELQFVQEDNILLSIKRGKNDKLLYNNTFKAEHYHEFESHFSYALGYSFIKQTPAGSIFFTKSEESGSSSTIPDINISEFSLALRYAPHEQFYQGKVYRTPVANNFPVIQIQYTMGSRAINNDFNYQNLRVTISKRFYPWIFGYTDVTCEGGEIFGKVPYPLLFIHRANQTYSYQISSYNLMNFLEFVSDQYVSLNVDHCFNGFIFNKLPLIKKLKLREVATCKVLYGKLSAQNNPKLQPGLFKFPVDAYGKTLTYTLEERPYIEASAGISNIFKFFRVDLVKRLTYLDHPNVSKTGIRIRFKFDF